MVNPRIRLKSADEDDILNTANVLNVVVVFERVPETHLNVAPVHWRTLVPLMEPVFVIVPVAVPLFPTPDLSLHVVRFDPVNDMVPASPASNHRVQFESSVGLNTGDSAR
jgi:hypothetical protein